jgi:hypothetical protein
LKLKRLNIADMKEQGESGDNAENAGGGAEEEHPLRKSRLKLQHLQKQRHLLRPKRLQKQQPLNQLPVLVARN